MSEISKPKETESAATVQIDFLKVVSERLGQATIVLTLDTYSHVLPNMQKDATDQLEQILYRKNGTF